MRCSFGPRLFCWIAGLFVVVLVHLVSGIECHAEPVVYKVPLGAPKINITEEKKYKFVPPEAGAGTNWKCDEFSIDGKPFPSFQGVNIYLGKIERGHAYYTMVAGKKSHYFELFPEGFVFVRKGDVISKNKPRSLHTIYSEVPQDGLVSGRYYASEFVHKAKQGNEKYKVELKLKNTDEKVRNELGVLEHVWSFEVRKYKSLGNNLFLPISVSNYKYSPKRKVIISSEERFPAKETIVSCKVVRVYRDERHGVKLNELKTWLNLPKFENSVEVKERKFR